MSGSTENVLLLILLQFPILDYS